MNIADIASQHSYSFHDHAIRVVMREGEPWFVAPDVAEVLGYRDAANAARHLPDKQKADTRILSTSSNGTKQLRQVTIVSEGGLYRLVLRSRKPEAEAFTDWVTDEVLPSIRKKGSYHTTSLPAPQEPMGLSVTLDEHTIYSISLLIHHFRGIHQWALVHKVPQALAWIGSPIGAELHDRLADGMWGGVAAIEKRIGNELAESRLRLQSRLGLAA